MSRVGKSRETEKLVIARGWGERRGGMGENPLNGYRVAFGGDENVLDRDRDSG